MHTKRCTKCGVEKALDEFHRRSRRRDGRACWCRLCGNAQEKERRAADPTYRERENAQQRERLAVPERRIRRLAGLAKERAQARGLDFDEDLSDLLPPPTHCPVLGIPLNYATGRGHNWDGPSIDRIDNSKGYVRGNRIVVSWRANRLKSDATTDELEAVVRFYKRLTERKEHQ